MFRLLLRRSGNRRGMTLVELIVSMAILGIFVLSTFSVFDFGARVFRKSDNVYRAQSNVKNAIGFVAADLKYATEVHLLTTAEAEAEIAAGMNYNYFYIKNDILYKAEHVSGSHRITIVANRVLQASEAFNKRDANLLLILLNSEEDGQIYQVGAEVLLDNLPLRRPTPGTITDSGHAITSAVRYSIVPTTAPAIAVQSVTVTSPVTPAVIDVADGTLQLTAVVLPIDASIKMVSWSVSDTAIATVSPSGLVTGQADGTVEVRATAVDGSGRYGVINVTMSNQGGVFVPVASVGVVSASGVYSITTKSGTLQMVANVVSAYPLNSPPPTNPAVTWGVDRSELASISSTGVLTALLDGVVLVTATATDGTGVSGSASVTISNQNILELTNVPKHGGSDTSTSNRFEIRRNTNHVWDFEAKGGTGGPYTLVIDAHSGWASAPTRVGMRLTAPAGNNNTNSQITVRVFDGFSYTSPITIYYVAKNHPSND